jgi:cytochrome c-type biogenesis protein CcmH
MKIASSFLVKLLVFMVLTTATSTVLAQDSNSSDAADDVAQKVSEAQKMGENYLFEDPNDRKTFLKLTAELRCPMCQNQNIADSDAMIAHDMRRKVYQLMLQGSSEQQVIDYMKARYGDFVHYQPPVTPVTIWLWALPVLFAFVMMGVFLMRRKVAPEENIEAKLAAANKLLKDDQ